MRYNAICDARFKMPVRTCEDLSRHVNKECSYPFSQAMADNATRSSQFDAGGEEREGVRVRQLEDEVVGKYYQASWRLHMV